MPLILAASVTGAPMIASTTPVMAYIDKDMLYDAIGDIEDISGNGEDTGEIRTEEETKAEVQKAYNASKNKINKRIKKAAAKKTTSGKGKTGSGRSKK